MSDASGKLFGLLCLGFGFGIYSFFKGFKLLRRKRFIENIPTSKIRSLAMGLVEIFGKVGICTDKKIASVALKSPVNGASCVYYDIKVEEYRRSGKHSHWATVHHRMCGVPFYVSDNTGRVLVNPNGATVDIPSDFKYTSGMLFSGMPQKCKDFCKRQGLLLSSFRTLRFTEKYLAPNDVAYVLGTAKNNPYIDSSAKNVENIMIGKGANEKLYYISDSAEKDLLKRLSRGVPLRVFGGPILSVACIVGIIFMLMYGF